MSLLDQATLLRNAAQAKKNKTSTRVSSDTLLAKVAAFLNDADTEFIMVDDVFGSGTTHSSIVSRFRTVIIANQLDELCYPVAMDDHVFIVKLVAPVTVEDDEDEDQ